MSWSEDDQEHVGLCTEFPSLSYLAETPAQALEGIKLVVVDVLKDMADSGEAPPSPLSLRAYSGEFRVRIPPRLHRNLVAEAEASHVSLNALVTFKLSK